MFTRVALATAALALVSAKISPKLSREIELTGSVPSILVVEFAPITDDVLSAADAKIESVSTRGAKIEAIYDTLVDYASRQQAGALDIIAQASHELKVIVSAKTLAVANILVLEGATPALLDRLATDANVQTIRHQYNGKLVAPHTAASEGSAPAATEWGVNKIAAPSLWEKGFTGKGVVVGGIDTGVLYTHEALKGNWRSENGFFQPVGNSQFPVDGHGHGSHTMGTSVGAGGIGVAPDAKWIACQGCLPDGSCPEVVLVACAQYMLCPHDYQGKNPKCELAPHVINNSWGDDNEIPDVPYYKGPVAAWRKAGIIPVFANANSGPKCGTVLSPGDYPNVIGVGATTSTDALAGFSSRGPGPKNVLKPDVSAPGQSVRSATAAGNSSYASWSGTSMATPHVVGAVALLISSKPTITYDEIYAALTKTAETSTLTPTNQTCGGLDDSKYPNNNYGYGRINVFKAASATPSPSTPSPTTTKPSC
ncbi:hypothetical protein H257_07322 [Aphanomyces astaci]|uniref:subtilisin n=2 Tax=Aphanomyces astaci TaxID=112090 RepID=W4GJR1_APHAT|nr:hypothetical protein H257_07322 [Aphanomyces astaci]ETV79259.1 hypothetical protein H257_07322 [Aphanomyces astaci]RHY18753.1 hypothetical protein DYB25_002320 [Aphanomyces astaci]RHZ33612.1 hypothetical protein DYB31_011009 [Aphanomyces astaci]RQM29577.1 hypothetical protein B5M09_005771 [Aphanomyces astaci]|eukprot:XP_009831100.1 hypothetical protein H257_07322 [Aphanomyces astaci]